MMKYTLFTQKTNSLNSTDPLIYYKYLQNSMMFIPVLAFNIMVIKLHFVSFTINTRIRTFVN